MTATTTATRTGRISMTTIATRVVWFAVWAFVTVFAWFEVIKHGYLEGSAIDAIVLTTVAVGAFVLPDLTFLVGDGNNDPVMVFTGLQADINNALDRPKS